MAIKTNLMLGKFRNRRSKKISLILAFLFVSAIGLDLVGCKTDEGKSQPQTPAKAPGNPTNNNVNRPTDPNSDGQKANPDSQARNLPNKGNTSQEKLIITPRDSHSSYLDLINSAKTSIDMVMFHLSDSEVVDALVSAATGAKNGKNKIKIRVILDQKILAKASNKERFDALKAAGIEAKASSTAFSITHQKSMVVDSRVAIIGTMNLVTTADKTRDFGLITADTEVIKEMNLVFETDWANATSNTDKTPNLTNARLVWSPVNSSDRLMKLVNSAKSKIDIYFENISYPEIEDALIKRASSDDKVDIRIITPGCSQDANPLRNVPSLKKLAEGGIQVRVMAPPMSESAPFIHAKVINVDTETFYLGSENLTKNSLGKARELGIITKNITLSAEINDAFEDDWRQAVQIEQITTEACQSP